MIILTLFHIDFVEQNNFQKNLNDVAKLVEEVFSESRLLSAFTSLPTQTLQYLCCILHRSGLISTVVLENPTSEDILNEFKASLPLLESTEEIKEHCKNFLDCLKEIGGPCTTIVRYITKKLIL